MFGKVDYICEVRLLMIVRSGCLCLEKSVMLYLLG